MSQNQLFNIKHYWRKISLSFPLYLPKVAFNRTPYSVQTSSEHNVTNGTEEKLVTVVESTEPLTVEFSCWGDRWWWWWTAKSCHLWFPPETYTFRPKRHQRPRLYSGRGIYDFTLDLNTWMRVVGCRPTATVSPTNHPRSYLNKWLKWALLSPTGYSSLDWTRQVCPSVYVIVSRKQNRRPSLRQRRFSPCALGW